MHGEDDEHRHPEQNGGAAHEQRPAGTQPKHQEPAGKHAGRLYREQQSPTLGAE